MLPHVLGQSGGMRGSKLAAQEIACVIQLLSRVHLHHMLLKFRGLRGHVAAARVLALGGNVIAEAVHLHLHVLG